MGQKSYATSSLHSGSTKSGSNFKNAWSRSYPVIIRTSISVLTGFEMANKYEVFNNMRQQVFFVAEGKNRVCH